MLEMLLEVDEEASRIQCDFQKQEELQTYKYS